MSNETVPATATVGNAAPATATTTAEAGSQTAASAAAQYVAAEDFRRLQEGVGKLFAAQRQIEQMLSAAKQQQPQEKPPEAKKDDLGLAQRLEALERERNELKSAQRNTALKSVAVDLGVPSTRTKFLISELASRLGDRLELDSLNDAWVRDDAGGKLPLRKYAEEFLKTDDGEMFRAAQSVAQMPVGGNGGAVANGRHPFSPLTAAQIVDAAKKPGGGELFLSYLKDYGDEYRAKKNAR